jgi:uncharacterized protein (UPF0305 family)
MAGKVYNPDNFLEWLRKTMSNLRIVGVPVIFRKAKKSARYSTKLYQPDNYIESSGMVIIIIKLRNNEE